MGGFVGQSQSRLVALAAAFVLVAMPALAFAEVMDKEPPASEFWIRTVPFAILGLLAWRYLPRVLALTAGSVSVLIGGVYLLLVLTEITDPFVGPAILEEAGWGYVLQYWGALFLFVVLEAIGVVAWRRRSRTSAST
jgi:hypothetical protein